MEVSASVEVFARDETTFYLVVEPSSAVSGLRKHLEAQTDEVKVVHDPTVGDVGLSLINGKTLDQVLGSTIRISNSY